jgi:hypothetical protein
MVVFFMGRGSDRVTLATRDRRENNGEVTDEARASGPSGSDAASSAWNATGPGDESNKIETIVKEASRG